MVPAWYKKTPPREIQHREKEIEEGKGIDGKTDKVRQKGWKNADVWLTEGRRRNGNGQEKVRSLGNNNSV